MTTLLETNVFFYFVTAYYKVFVLKYKVHVLLCSAIPLCVCVLCITIVRGAVYSSTIILVLGAQVLCVLYTRVH